MAYLLTGLGAVILALAAYCAVRNRGKAVGLLVMPALIALMFGYPEGLQKIRATFGASTVETTFQQKIDDATKIINQLRALAVNTAKSLIQLRENSHSLIVNGGNEFAEQDAYKASLLQSLRDMDIPAETIKEVEQSDSNVVLNFYSNAAWRFGSDGFLPDEKKRQEFNKAFWSLSAEQQRSPEQLQKLFDDFHIDSSRFSPYMDDFRYYVSKKEQRRPEVWAQRETWGFGWTTPGSVFQTQRPLHN